MHAGWPGAAGSAGMRIGDKDGRNPIEQDRIPHGRSPEPPGPAAMEVRRPGRRWDGPLALACIQVEQDGRKPSPALLGAAPLALQKP